MSSSSSEWPSIDDGSGGEGGCGDALFTGSVQPGVALGSQQDPCSVWERRIEFHTFEVRTGRVLSGAGRRHLGKFTGGRHSHYRCTPSGPSPPM